MVAALPSFTTAASTTTARTLASFTTAASIITVYVPPGMMDNVGEDALECLKDIVLRFCGIFIESSPPFANYVPRVFELSFHSINVAVYGGQNMVDHKIDGNLWDAEAQIV
jgi:hypothetical protein